MQGKWVKAVILLLGMTAVIFSSSCKRQATDSLSVYDIESEISQCMTNYSEMEDCSEEYLSEIFQINTDDTVELVSKRSLDTHIDQFGILKQRDEESASEMAKKINGSIENLKREWDGRYFSEENAKISAARAAAFGKYVVFAVLDAKETDTVMKKLEEIVY